MVLAVVVAAAALPSIAGSLAPGLVAGAAKGSIAGSVSVQKVRVSWGGPQVVEGLQIRDPQGRVVADITANASKGLIGLALAAGSMDVGTVSLRGKVDVEQTDKGNTLQLALAAPPGTPATGGGAGAPSGGPSKLPASLSARLVVEGLSISYTDKGGAIPGGPKSAVIPDIKGEAVVAVGKPITAKFGGAGTVDGKPTTLSIDAVVSGWSTPDGKVTPELATIDGVAEASLPAPIVAALAAGPGVKEPARSLINGVLAGPRNNLGEQVVALAIKAKGDAKRTDALLNLAAGGATVDVEAVATNAMGPNGRVMLSKPGVATVILTPAMAAAVTDGPSGPLLVLDQPVTATVRIDALDAPVPAGALDLRGAKAAIALETSAITGSVRPAGQQPMALQAEPLRATVASEDFGKGVSVRATGAATLDGRPAGNLAVDVQASGLLDDKGAPRGLPSAMNGRAEIKGLATAILAPFVKGAPLDLERDIGPALNVLFQAQSQNDETGLTLAMEAANLALKAAAATDGKRLRTTGDGVEATIRNASPVLAAALKDAGVSVRGGALRATVSNLDLALGGPIAPDRIRADARVEAAPMSLAVNEQERIDLSTLTATASLAPGEPARATLASEALYGGAPFEVGADMAVANLFGKDGKVNAMAARPVGVIRVNNAPSALLNLAGQTPEIALARDLIGRSMTLTVNAAEGKGGTDIVADLKAGGLTTNASAGLTPERVELRGVTGSAVLSPALLGRIIETYAKDLKQRPTLAQPTPLNFEVGPMAIPLKGGKADMANATPIKAKATLAAPLAMRGLDLGGERTADIGVRGLAVEAAWSLAENGPKEGNVRAQVFDPRGDAPVALLLARANLSRKGAPEVAVDLAEIDTGRLDETLGMPGLTSLSLGSPAALTATLRPLGADGAQQAEVGVKSPRLTTAAAVEVRKDRAVLTKPMDVSWAIDKRWASRYLTPSEGGRPPAVALSADAPLTVRVDRLAIATGEGSGPLRAGVFEIAAKASLQNVALVTAENLPMKIGAAEATIRTVGVAATDQALGFDVSLRGVSGPEGQGDAGEMKASGTVGRFADASGKPLPESAEVTLDADGRLPTALVDALGGGGDKINELLGTTTQVKAQARGLSKNGGTLSATVGAARADAAVEGRIENGVFRSSKPITATVREITPRLSQLTIEQALPLFTKFEKRREDGPARLTVTDLALPIKPEIASKPGGPPDEVDLRKLNGLIRLELGPVRYDSGDLLSGMLNLKSLVPDVKEKGSMFNRFPPLEVRVTNGVAEYDRTVFPVGEFTIETRGKVDLAAKQMDLIVYVPLVGVADEFLGVFRSVPGLNNSANVPFRVKGPFGKAVPVPAPDLILKDALGDVKKDPEKVIEDIGKGIEDLIKRRKK